MVRTRGAPLRWRSAPPIVLLVLGTMLMLGPIFGGMFAKVASGKQLIDRFEPHLTPDALARYDADLAVLRQAAAGLDEVYAEQQIAPGQFPLLDTYRAQAPTIDRRATDLLTRIRAAEPDYRKVASIGGFERVPFLIVIAGATSVYGAAILLGRNRGRGRAAAGVVVVAGLCVAVAPFLSSLPSGGRAGARMLESLAPVMTADQVRSLQSDFVVLVQADGQIDTSFRPALPKDQAGDDVVGLVTKWPAISSDLAALVGTMNDDLGNYRAMRDLDGITSPVGVSGFEAMPWLLGGLGITVAALALLALPRRAAPDDVRRTAEDTT